MARWLYGLAQGAARRAKLVVILWLALLVGVTLLGTMLAGETESSVTIPGTESQDAQDLLAREFPSANGGTMRVVFASQDGVLLSDPPIQQEISSSLEHAAAVSDVISVSDLTTSESGTIAFADVTFEQLADDVPTAAKDAVEEAMDPARNAGLQVEFAGDAAEGSQASMIGELLGLLLSFIILFFTLGSLIAAGMPLVTAAAGVFIGLMSMQFLSRFIDVSSTAPALASMLGLAVGIDYALFIALRHREQLADPTMSVSESIGRAAGTAGSAVVFAGTSVIVALVALSAVGIPFLSVMGLVAAGTVLVAVLVALTLLPAFLSLAGERLRPKTSRVNASLPPIEPQKAKRRSLWRRWADFIARAPGVVLVVSVVLLAIAAIPVLDIRLGLPSNQIEPDDSTLHKSYQLLTEGFGEGFNANMVYVVDVTAVRESERTGLLTALADTIRLDPGVAEVSDPVFNQAQNVSLLSIVPHTGPDDDATKDLVERLRDQPRTVIEQSGGAGYVAGATPMAIDVSDKLSSALPMFVVIIVVLAIILLAIAFRSLVVPVKAVIGFLLSMGASLGATVFVFQQGHFLDMLGVGAAAPIVSFVPVILVGVLFGLAMDYEVFLVSRMREHYHHTGNAREAVIEGVAQSGRVVCAAALIMTGVFGGFLISGEPTVKSIALSLAVGVLADAFIVRMTIVPAVMLFLGERAWGLPRLLDRLLPNVDIEGASLPARAERTDLVEVTR